MSSTQAAAPATHPAPPEHRPPAPAGTPAAAGCGGDGSGPGDGSARRRLDDLDARIIALVQERCAESDRVRRARVEAGGGRVQLAREMEVLEHYREALGRPGTRLAMTLLELCRGEA